MSAVALPLVLGTTFEDDVNFMKQHTTVIVLEDAAARTRVAVVPA